MTRAGLLSLFSLETVDPVGSEHVDQEYYRGNGPGNGVGGKNKLDRVGDGHGYGDVKDPEYAPDTKHYEHGDLGLAGTPHDSCNGMRKGQQAVEQ